MESENWQEIAGRMLLAAALALVFPVVVGCAGGDYIPEGYHVTPKGEVLSPEQYDADLAEHYAERDRRVAYEQAKRQEEDKYRIPTGPSEKKLIDQPKPPEKPKAVEPSPGVRQEVGKVFTPDPNFYVGLYGGPTFGNVSANNPTFFDRGIDEGIPITVKGNFTSHATTTTNLTGGLKLGTWGTYPCLPPWMKYVGVNLDFSYQNLNLQHQTGYFMEGITEQGGQFAIAGGLAGLSSSTGSLSTLGLTFTGRYGFFPNPEVSSFGQLQPYLGVGPVLGIASLAPTFTFINFTNLYGQQVNTPINETHKLGSKTSVFPALGVEAGLRYLPLRNVYLDVSYRYLRGQPSFSFNEANFRFNLDPTYNNHSLRIGVGYMF